ncbi:hypothetical protein BpHYR1_017346 [Brachionus plicatilis]|uniref:Uncharacterized protein n=1 Tax=Brachionus plicatilis TaxID=10195 RepID=A0A3M7RUN0_BRAPC|nr:hypothetical protein BpHYR1_017346 [Brachionus plicatilis]
MFSIAEILLSINFFNLFRIQNITWKLISFAFILIDNNCGRPPKLSDRDVSYIFRLVRKDPTTSYRQIAADFNSKFEEHKISRETDRSYGVKITVSTI